MRAQDGFLIENVDATPADFTIKLGGVYVLDAVATWGGGSLTLTRRGPDKTTYLTAATALTANGTSGAITLPPGIYRWTIATATAVYASLVRVPGE